MHDFFHWSYKLCFISIEFITLSVIHGLFIALRIVDLGIESVQVSSIAVENKIIVIIYEYVKKFISI